MATLASSSGSETLQPTLYLLEHVNLNIPKVDAALVRQFFEELGAAFNPTGSNERQVHVNVGVSQFHLPFVHSISSGEAVLANEAQIWRGTIELRTTEEPASIAARLEKIPALSKCIVELYNDVDGEQLLSLRLPWGLGPETNEDHKSSGSSWSSFARKATLLIRKCDPLLETKVRCCRGHDGGMGKLISMERITHLVKPGAAACLHSFFSEVLGCSKATISRSMASTMATCTIPFQSNAGTQTLAFRESELAGENDAYDTNPQAQYHLAIYLPSAVQFSRAFIRAEELGLIFINERFEGGPLEFASSKTLEEAMVCGQFRVKNLIHTKTGRLGLTLELEVRSPTHKCFPFADLAAPSALSQTNAQEEEHVSSFVYESSEGSSSDRLSPLTPERRHPQSRSDIALTQLAISPPGSPSLSYEQQQNMVALLMTAGSPQRSPSRSALPLSPLHRAHVPSQEEHNAMPVMTL